MKLVSLKNTVRESVSHNPEVMKQVLIKNGEIPNVTQLSKTVFKPHQVASSHKHADMYEVFLTEKGEGTMIINDKSYSLEPGICITVEPGESHEVVNNSEDDLVITILGILA